MTPEEKAVIDAALTWEREHPAKDHWTDASLDLAVSALLAARRVEEQGAPDEMLWVERTWRDVRAGDTVRPPASDSHAVVDSSQLQSWHVDPRGSTYSPVPLEHDVMCVYLKPFGQGEPKRYDMNPDAPVEILVAFSELDFLNRHGWADRIATITEEG